MTEKTLTVLEQTLVDTINTTKAGVSQGLDFAQKQIPDVIEQLLMWKFTESLISFIMGISLLLGSVWSMIYAFKKFKSGNWDLEASPLGMILILPFLISFVYIDLTWLKIWIAPKLFLLEYVAKLIK